MERLGTGLGAAAIVLALAGCGSSQPEAGTSTTAAGISANQAYANATAIADAMTVSGVACEQQEQVDASGTHAASLVHCAGEFGTLGLYQFASSADAASWTDTLKLLCGNPGGDEYISGSNWAILPTDLRGNANTDALAAKLGLTASKLC